MEMRLRKNGHKIPARSQQFIDRELSRRLRRRVIAPCATAHVRLDREHTQAEVELRRKLSQR